MQNRHAVSIVQYLCNKISYESYTSIGEEYDYELLLITIHNTNIVKEPHDIHYSNSPSNS